MQRNDRIQSSFETTYNAFKTLAAELEKLMQQPGITAETKTKINEFYSTTTGTILPILDIIKANNFNIGAFKAVRMFGQYSTNLPQLYSQLETLNIPADDISDLVTFQFVLALFKAVHKIKKEKEPAAYLENVSIPLIKVNMIIENSPTAIEGITKALANALLNSKHMNELSNQYTILLNKLNVLLESDSLDIEKFKTIKTQCHSLAQQYEINDDLKTYDDDMTSGALTRRKTSLATALIEEIEKKFPESLNPSSKIVAPVDNNHPNDEQQAFDEAILKLCAPFLPKICSLENEILSIRKNGIQNSEIFKTHEATLLNLINTIDNLEKSDAYKKLNASQSLLDIKQRITNMRNLLIVVKSQQLHELGNNGNSDFHKKKRKEIADQYCQQISSFKLDPKKALESVKYSALSLFSVETRTSHQHLLAGKILVALENYQDNPQAFIDCLNTINLDETQVKPDFYMLINELKKTVQILELELNPASSQCFSF